MGNYMEIICYRKKNFREICVSLHAKGVAKGYG